MTGGPKRPIRSEVPQAEHQLFEGGLAGSRLAAAATGRLRSDAGGLGRQVGEQRLPGPAGIVRQAGAGCSRTVAEYPAGDDSQLRCLVPARSGKSFNSA